MLQLKRTHVIFVIASINFLFTAQDVRPLITTRNGPIQGITRHTSDQKKAYSAFFGIPYAVPPVGDLRFDAPIPAQNWTEIRDSSQAANFCVQGIPPDIEGSEDCLYLNVYSPQLPRPGKEPLVTLVWISGGGFFSANISDTSIGPDYFMKEDVIIVVSNYRLNIFGFLSTEDDVSPGNYGIKDQLLMLRWVHENIAAFGGDPEKVTIFGESAGGAIVSYFLQTNLTNGLFQSAISLSGHSLCSWALTRDPLTQAQVVAEVFNISTATTTDLVAGLKNINATELYTTAFGIAAKQVITASFLNGFSFGPTVEPGHSNAVITGKSHELLTEGKFLKLPHLVGFASNETMNLTYLLKIVSPDLIRYDIDPTPLTPLDMNVPTKERVKKSATLIRNSYFPNHKISIGRIVDYINDNEFIRPILEGVKLESQSAPVYLYRFAYSTDGQGAPHASIIQFLFNRTTAPLKTSLDFLTRDRLVKMLSNFAKFGNPTPEKDPLLQNVMWPLAKAESGNLLYLDIDKDLSVKTNFREKEMQMWEALYRDYGTPPFNTY